jgi:uncharacterized membrane protein YcaP (DUF421 family)
MDAAVLADALRSMVTNVESILGIVLRTVAVYFCVLAGLRLMGKREVGQMTPFDLVLVLLLANSVQNAMVGPDNSLVGGLAAAGVLLLLNMIVSRVAAGSPRMGRFLRGHARLLVNRGILVEKNCAEEGLTREDVLQALREHGVASLEDVRLAVLEVDGTISVLKYDDVSGDTNQPHRRFRFQKKG